MGHFRKSWGGVATDDPGMIVTELPVLFALSA